MDNESEIFDIGSSSSIVNDGVRSALRDFAGRIAHDFNNLLTAQLAYPDLIKHYLTEDSPAHELLDILEKNSDLMTTISDRLAHFALPSNYAKKDLAIDDTVSEVLSDFAGNDTLLNITVKRELNSGGEVMIPHDVFCRIMKEICANSVESMNGKGTLAIKTSIMNIADPITANDAIVPLGDYVCLNVRDSGSGINNDTLKKVFDPFVTNSKQSKPRGSGLGLSIAFSSVRDCGGFMLIGECSEGCDVSVILPVAVAECSDVSGTSSDENVGTGSRHVLLLVDDEEEITKIFKIILTSAIKGIHIDTAKNGSEALEIFKKHKHSVIVMDLHMPVMDGYEAFCELEKLCRVEGISMPGVVFCTGYVPKEGIQKVISSSSKHSLLKKPVATKTLINVVKECLDK